MSAWLTLLEFFSKNAALRRAASTVDCNAISRLIGMGADVNSGALHKAAKGAHVPAAEVLLDAGADVNKQKGGLSALHWAVFSGDSGIVKCLLSRGARLDLPGEAKCLPIHCATTRDLREILDILLSHGADINARDSLGWTPLHYAACGNDKTRNDILLHTSQGTELKFEQRRCDDKHIRLARYMLERSADVNAKTNEGNTPLHFAARWGFGPLIRLFLDSGANVNASNGTGETPLHWLALLGTVDLAKTLLEKGSDVNARTTMGSTPLHGAAVQGHKAMVSWLIESGADLTATRSSPSGRNMTALDVARASGHRDIVRLLK